MPTYIALLRFTQKGIETIKEGPSRLDRARQAFKAAGAQLKAFSLATGRHDAIAIIDAPNDEAVARTVGDRPGVHGGGIPEDHCRIALRSVAAVTDVPSPAFPWQPKRG